MEYPWNTGVIPTDWRRGVVVLIWKGKGDTQDFNNHGGLHFSPPRFRLSVIKSIETVFRNSVGLDSPPRSIVRHPRLPAILAIRHQNHRNGFPLFRSYRFTASFDYPPLTIIRNSRNSRLSATFDYPLSSIFCYTRLSANICLLLMDNGER